GRRLRIWCDQDPDEPDQPQLGSRTRAPEDGVLGQLALQARGGAVAGVEGGGRRQPQKLGADAHHLPAEVGLGHLPPDAAGKDRVADECMVGDDEAHAPRRMARCVHDLDLELAKPELIAVDQIPVRGAQELFGVGRVDAGLAGGRESGTSPSDGLCPPPPHEWGGAELTYCSSTSWIFRRSASSESNLSRAGLARGRSGYLAVCTASSRSSISSSVKFSVL